MGYAGIDYGLGKSNVDKATGIRYGVINQNALNSDAVDEIQQNGDDLSYEAWKEEVIQSIGQAIESAVDDYGYFDKSHVGEIASDVLEALDLEYTNDEPSSYRYEDGDTHVEMGSDGDIFVTKSPYFTYAQFCSPCAPGACHLEHHLPEGEGAKCYCLDKEWFDNVLAENSHEYDRPCPYPYWNVETGELVYSPK